MSKFEFHRIEYKKFDTCTIVIAGASFKLENSDIFQKEKNRLRLPENRIEIVFRKGN